MLTLALATGSMSPAHGQTEILSDPMRPADHAPVRASAQAPAAESGVNLVLTSPERKLAVIDGRIVRLGGDVGDATLVGLSDTAAVLEKKDGRDVLLLHPAIDKKPAGKKRR